MYELPKGNGKTLSTYKLYLSFRTHQTGVGVVRVGMAEKRWVCPREVRDCRWDRTGEDGTPEAFASKVTTFEGEVGRCGDTRNRNGSIEYPRVV